MLYTEIMSSGEQLFFTESVLAEFVTFMCRKEGIAVTVKCAETLFETKTLEMLVSTPADAREALKKVKQYSLESYADGLQVAVMQRQNCRKIVSFDSDFDRVKEVERIA